MDAEDGEGGAERRRRGEEEEETGEGKEGIWPISRDKRWEMDFIRQHSLKYE